ncbi:GspH/FimT family pseudopilin [Endozoicomonas ascidiicola]|uniref:GspH/FimT family pseudopilin n=1 Tax=Endozoicomonas ascidiicola TaxID=1698521 RepID=UPI00082EE569|nr:GspH/FimT family pseudopilin [Endozoicomonas ascidiicola]
MTKHDQKGFTLLELMVTIAILGILSAIAYPSFESSIQDSRLSSQTNRILAALQFARSQASANGIAITVCSSADGIDCDVNGNWSDGFIVVEGINILQVSDALEGDNTLQGRTQINFTNQGTLDSSIQLSLCDTRGTASARGIWLNGAGQARTGGAPICAP